MNNLKVGDKVRAIKEYDNKKPSGVGYVARVNRGGDYWNVAIIFPEWKNGHNGYLNNTDAFIPEGYDKKDLKYSCWNYGVKYIDKYLKREIKTLKQIFKR